MTTRELVERMLIDIEAPLDELELELDADVSESELMVLLSEMVGGEAGMATLH